jgi:hypothetical protein
VWDKSQNPCRFYGLGLLYTLKYISEERIFYCPAQRENGFNYKAYTMPFLSVASQDYYVSYMYNDLI